MTSEVALSTESVRFVAKTWLEGTKKIRALMIAIALFCLLLVLGIVLATSLGVRDQTIKLSLVSIVFVLAFATFVIAMIQALADENKRERKIESVEERVRQNPDRPQFAWDLARTRLESYLDRNLSQVRSIYRLTLLVMFCGLAFVMYGLYQAFQDTTKLPVSIVASASGVVITFIGGSFLLVFRSILAESRGYVSVLERINAVGMAVQVISSIPEANAELKHSTTANLAKQLLNLYARSPCSMESAEINEKATAQQPEGK